MTIKRAVRGPALVWTVAGTDSTVSEGIWPDSTTSKSPVATLISRGTLQTGAGGDWGRTRGGHGVLTSNRPKRMLDANYAEKTNSERPPERHRGDGNQLELPTVNIHPLPTRRRRCSHQHHQFRRPDSHRRRFRRSPMQQRRPRHRHRRCRRLG